MNGDSPEYRVRLLYVTAYCQLHEVVRMHLAGEVNQRYLRRRHGEIEEELRAEVGSMGHTWDKEKADQAEHERQEAEKKDG